jgi:hypothetical protein
VHQARELTCEQHEQRDPIGALGALIGDGQRSELGNLLV